MTKLRMAQELWFHALVYYAAQPLKSVLSSLGISSKRLNNIVSSAKYMEINNDDERAYIYVITWVAVYMIRSYFLSWHIGIAGYIHI